MRVKTLIATVDTAYTGHISEYISEHHSDTVEISVCNTLEDLQRTLTTRRYDVALMDTMLIGDADLKAVNLPLLLWTDRDADSIEESLIPTLPVKLIRKHKRISKTVADILQQYATVKGNEHVSGEMTGNITAVWSPSGGVGKTTTALAYAASMKDNASTARTAKESFYLNLEDFSATSVHFEGHGKSISEVFEMLENGDGNIKMLLQGICGYENGVKYLCAPDNFDDMCILSPDNIRELVLCCAGIADELVIDLPSVCDARTRAVFELADKVLLVTDSTDSAKVKLAQFTSQSNVFEGIKEKYTLVVNKCATGMMADRGAAKANDTTKSVVFLPYIQATDAQFIYRTLANSDFGG